MNTKATMMWTFGGYFNRIQKKNVSKESKLVAVYKAIEDYLMRPNCLINYQDFYGSTLLMYICSTSYSVEFECGNYGGLVWCNKNIKELLKVPNIDYNHKNEEGESALTRACYHRNVVAVKALLEMPDIDTDVTYGNGKTIFKLAEDMNSYDILHALNNHKIKKMLCKELSLPCDIIRCIVNKYC